VTVIGQHRVRNFAGPKGTDLVRVPRLVGLKAIAGQSLVPKPVAKATAGPKPLALAMANAAVRRNAVMASAAVPNAAIRQKQLPACSSQRQIRCNGNC
jgi:hypothetical protein